MLCEGPDCHLIRTRQFLPLPLEEVHAFFQDPRNLARITPPWLQFRILHPEGVRMERGAQIDYTIRWLGLPLRWRTVISDYNPPRSFEDTQARGPYSLWVHRHVFRPVGGGTLVEDEVRYRLPLGVLGRVAHRVLVARQLHGIFAYRALSTRRLLLRPSSE